MSVRKISIVKNTEKPVQNYRLISQVLFAVVSIWIGIEFYQFIAFVSSNGILGSAYRPAGVEAYLPISSLMSFLYFLFTGLIHPVHPAGFFLFIGFLAVSLIAGKSFCSWVCPIGFMSEYVGAFGQHIMKKKIVLPKFLDYPLRSLKYLLLGFFSLSIFAMSAAELKVFLDGDYNIIADVKLFDFFFHMSQFTVIVLTLLFIASIFIRNFWCRYLCPYGALFGILSLASIFRIKRNANTCIDCSLCDKSCPSHIKIMKSGTVISDECTSCMNCVDSCPVENTLEFKPMFSNIKMNKKNLIWLLIIVYSTILAGGYVSGHWKSSVPVEKYHDIYENRENIGHQ
ncbi:MAG: 4Fe-4S binding protein [Ignavibacteria bacterium]|nr:4Fe-4S binding protein [Ignavibacteria bacterium]